MSVIYMRMLAYAGTLVMHGLNLFTTNNLLQGSVMEDPNIRTFTGLYKRFFTIWTMFLQIFVALMGLTSDYLTLKYSNKQEPRLLSLLRSTKNRIFAAVLWPTAFHFLRLVSTMFWSLYLYDRSLIYPLFANKILASTSNHIMHTAIIPLVLWELVSTMFWSLYHYDRSLIYPLFADKVLTSTSNHIMHTAIIPLVLWEAVFQPRSVPKSHAVNVTMLAVYMFTYLSVMCYTYSDQGVWMYPVFGLAYNISIFCFALSIAIIGVALYIYYHMQWIITRIVWGSQTKLKQ